MNNEQSCSIFVNLRRNFYKSVRKYFRRYFFPFDTVLDLLANFGRELEIIFSSPSDVTIDDSWRFMGHLNRNFWDCAIFFRVFPLKPHSAPIELNSVPDWISEDYFFRFVTREFFQDFLPEWDSWSTLSSLEQNFNVENEHRFLGHAKAHIHAQATYKHIQTSAYTCEIIETPRHTPQIRIHGHPRE